jgi:hypothetical protein
MVKGENKVSLCLCLDGIYVNVVPVNTLEYRVNYFWGNTLTVYFRLQTYRFKL